MEMQGMYLYERAVQYIYPPRGNLHVSAGPSEPQPAPAALLTGTILLDAKSKVIKPELPFTFCLTRQKDLHG